MGAEFDDADYARLRHCMVDDQLCARHIGSEQILAVMEKVPRHLFVPVVHRRAAYDDGPVPIGLGQTISQPYMVARMTELLRLTPSDRVLEIGTGSGYQTAVLAEIVQSVWTVERHLELARRAEDLLVMLGYRNVTVITGDGSVGFADAAPYDAIIVTAAAPRVPQCLRDQLGSGGRMVIPVSTGYNQDLRLIERLSGNRESLSPTREPLPDSPATPQEPAGPGGTSAPDYRFCETSILGCVFVPLIGEQGYAG